MNKGMKKMMVSLYVENQVGSPFQDFRAFFRKKL